MEQISIVTAQNVELKMELASVGDRFLASILDFLIKVGMTFSLASIAVSAGAMFINVMIVVTLFIVWCFYSVLFEFFWDGQTPGKGIMRLKVVRLDGLPLTMGNLLQRWAMRIIDFPLWFPTIGIITILSNEKRQRLGDIVAGTVIITSAPHIRLADTLYTEIKGDYKPRFYNADQLTAREIEIIKEVLDQYQLNDNYELITLTANKVKQTLQINSDLDDLGFIKAILKDYNFFSTTENKADYNNESFSFNV